MGASWALMPLAGLAWLLQGCTQEGPSRPPATVYSVDLQGGARVCNAPKQLSPTEGRPTDVQIAVDNDGGWCAVTVAAPGDQPYAAGLLTSRPAHGKVYIHTVGYTTRIDYTPARNFTGTDSFVVELLPGSPTVHVSVTVRPAGAPAGSGPKA